MNKERTELNKELKVIDFYCKKCKKSMRISYMVGRHLQQAYADDTQRCHSKDT